MNKKAFTLVELLVVISIIALLLSILMPSLSRARDQGRAIACAHNSKTLSLGWFAYLSDNGGKLVAADPFWGGPSWYGMPEDEHGNFTWRYDGGGWSGSKTLEDEKRGIKKGKLFSYVGTVDVYHCLSDKRSVDENATWIPGSKGGYRSYSIVQCMNGWIYGTYVGTASTLAKSVKQYADIRSPSGRYVFIQDNDSRGFNMGPWTFDPDRPMWSNPLATWHHDKGILGFADGHSEIHKWKDKRTITFKWGDIRPQKGNQDLIFMQIGWATYTGPVGW